MATVNIPINNSTWTEVLSGEGFVISGLATHYAFNTSATITDFFVVPANGQVNGAFGAILYAKSPTSATATVASSPSA